MNPPNGFLGPPPPPPPVNENEDDDDDIGVLVAVDNEKEDDDDDVGNVVDVDFPPPITEGRVTGASISAPINSALAFSIASAETETALFRPVVNPDKTVVVGPVELELVETSTDLVEPNKMFDEDGKDIDGSGVA